MHDSTDETKKIVSNMCAGGMTQEMIAELLGISVPTLKKHYDLELKTAKSDVIQRVVGKLIANCMLGDNASIFFYLKTQGGFSEKNSLALEFNLPILDMDEIPETENDK